MSKTTWIQKVRQLFLKVSVKSVNHEQVILQKLTGSNVTTKSQFGLIQSFKNFRTFGRGVTIICGILVLYSLFNPGFVHQYVLTFRNGIRTKREMNQFVAKLNQDEEKFDQLIQQKYNKKLEKQYVRVTPQQLSDSSFFELNQ